MDEFSLAEAAPEVWLDNTQVQIRQTQLPCNKNSVMILYSISLMMQSQSWTDALTAIGHQSFRTIEYR